MIYEYAIEPELVVTWGKSRAEYGFFYDKFGLGTPRMMAEFPKFKNWRRQFKQAAAGADETNELPRLTALFSLLQEKMVRREGYEYDGNQSWLENAEIEHTRQEFQAILAKTNPKSNKSILAPGTMDAVVTNALWGVKEQDSSPRQPTDMALCITAMLSNCSEAHFIDPHFEPGIWKWQKPLEAFLDVIVRNRSCRPAIEKIMLHVSGEDTKQSIEEFKRKCETRLQSELPAGLKLTIQRWRQRNLGEKIHERYVLTDIGGVKVGPGIDAGEEGETFEAMLLKRDFYDKAWKNYVQNPGFDPAESPFDITGTKMMR